MTLNYGFCKPILIFLGQSPEISSAGATFVYRLIPQIFAYAANFPIQKFLQAQSIVAPSAYIAGGTLIVHLILSLVVVYKLGLGLLGASFKEPTFMYFGLFWVSNLDLAAVGAEMVENLNLMFGNLNELKVNAMKQSETLK